jgi:acetate kinase
MSGFPVEHSLLTVNVGSSSVRLVAYDAHTVRLADAHYAHRDSAPQAQATLQEFARRKEIGRIGAVVHRVVHGGERYREACRLDAAVEGDIAALAELAPLHNPAALAWAQASRAVFAEATQLAVFDTAFYADLPESARHYPLPNALSERLRLRRYGFHGLAHRFLWQRWQRGRRRPEGRAIALQLGSGCSITAIRDGVPLDTSMGFSPLEGLMMATRSGDVDPGLLLYLQRKEALSAEQLEDLLSHQSGLLGVSGVSGDMQELLLQETGRAALAVDLFCYRARKYVGAYLAVMGGADAILFGGGIGEHAPTVRARILEGLAWAGIQLDARSNAAALGRESRIDAEGAVEVWAIPVDESVIMAQDAFELLRSK